MSLKILSLRQTPTPPGALKDPVRRSSSKKVHKTGDFVETSTARAARSPRVQPAKRWVEPTIDVATFDYAKHVQAVAQGPVTLTALRERLSSEFGLGTAEANALIEATEKMQDAWGDRAIAEMWTELSVLAFTCKDFFGNFDEMASHPQLAPRRQSTGDSHYVLRTDVNELAEKAQKLSVQEIRASGLKVADLFVGHYTSDRDEEPPVSPWEKVAIAQWLTGPYGQIQTPAELLAVLKEFRDIPYQKRHTDPGFGECATVNPEASQALKERNLYVVVCGTPNKRSAAGDDHVFLRFFPLNGAPIDIDYSFNQFTNPSDKKTLVAGPVAAYHDEIGDLIRKHGGSRNNERFFEGAPKTPGCVGISPAVVQEIAKDLGLRSA